MEGVTINKYMYLKPAVGFVTEYIHLINPCIIIMCVCVQLCTHVHMGYHSNGSSCPITCSFQASNNMERSVWIEKIQESILNALNLAPEKKEGKKGVRSAVSQHILLL